MKTSVKKKVDGTAAVLASMYAETTETEAGSLSVAIVCMVSDDE